MIVLLDRARPERLGDVVRHVLRERPDAEVLTEAAALGTLPEGSTVILCVRAMDAGWLNQERPVVQARALRLLLFSDEETTLHLSRTAVDFYDWISHRIDCPAGPPAFAVRALRRAACARAPAVAWGGGDLEGSFARALPGRRLARTSAAQPYAELVEALSPRAQPWMAVEGIDGATRQRRVLWAAAEAGRRGRLVLVEPAGETSWPGLRGAHARALAVEEGAARLRAAGIGRSARLAAVLELSPEAIEDAAKLAGAGMAEADLERVALGEEDPGAALARLAEERGLQETPVAEREVEGSGAEPRGRFRLPDWPARIEMALQAGDPKLAARWAAGWRVATGEDARSTAALARMRLLVAGAVGEARALIEAACRQAAGDVDEDTRLELLRAEGLVLQAEGYAIKAIQPLKKALDLARRLGRTPDEGDELHDALVRALISAGRFKEAERALDTWPATARAQGSQEFDPLTARAEASLMLARGDVSSASQMLEQTLARWPDSNHPGIGAIEQLLAQVWIEQRRYREAERLMRAAIERFDRLALRTTPLRHEHARALFGLGRFQEAEQEFRRVLELEKSQTYGAITRHELARCLTAQGRLDEADAMLDMGMEELRQLGAAQMPDYAASLYEKAHIRRLRGDLAVAAELLREVLGLEERTLGREHPTLLPTLAELGGALIDLGKAREAEPLLRRAVRVAEQAVDPLGLAGALGELSRAQAAQGFQHARDMAHRALAAWAEAKSEPPPALRRELEAIAAGAAPRPSGPLRSRR